MKFHIIHQESNKVVVNGDYESLHQAFKKNKDKLHDVGVELQDVYTTEFRDDINGDIFWGEDD
jgi:hypothetical protein